MNKNVCRAVMGHYRAALDSSVIPYVLKSKLRDQLEIVSRQSLALRNKQLMAKVDESIQAVKTVFAMSLIYEKFSRYKYCELHARRQWREYRRARS